MIVEVIQGQVELRAVDEGVDLDVGVVAVDVDAVASDVAPHLVEENLRRVDPASWRGLAEVRRPEEHRPVGLVLVRRRQVPLRLVGDEGDRHRDARFASVQEVEEELVRRADALDGLDVVPAGGVARCDAAVLGDGVGLDDSPEGEEGVGLDHVEDRLRVAPRPLRGGPGDVDAVVEVGREGVHVGPGDVHEHLLPADPVAEVADFKGRPRARVAQDLHFREIGGTVDLLADGREPLRHAPPHQVRIGLLLAEHGITRVDERLVHRLVVLGHVFVTEKVLRHIVGGDRLVEVVANHIPRVLRRHEARADVPYDDAALVRLVGEDNRILADDAGLRGRVGEGPPEEPPGAHAVVLVKPEQVGVARVAGVELEKLGAV
mmetsp:Transcript_2568/g.8612  ORF Transcript_2568/g.8612 Transcript_2568/m.8612 type:complete len:376 (+) Transcript_2568:2544-3671(+)